MCQFTGSGSLGVSGADTRVYDIEFYNDAGLAISSAPQARVENCSFFGDAGVYIDGPIARIWLVDNFFEVTAIAIQAIERPSELAILDNHIATSSLTVDAVDLDIPTDLLIRGNFITGGRNNIRITDSGFQSLVTHNLVIDSNTCQLSAEESVYIDGDRTLPSYTRITNNLVQSSGINLGSLSNTGAIHVIGDPTENHDPLEQNEPGVLIAHNTVEGCDLLRGINIIYLHQAMVKDNRVENTADHGIYIEETSAAEVSGNQVVWPQDANAYDAIYVTGDSDYNYIHANTIINDSSDSWRYGINIADASAYCNIVVGNTFSPGFGTDPLNDGGTETHLFYPSDATYGDNFLWCYGS